MHSVTDLDFYEKWNNADPESLSRALMCKWVWHFRCLRWQNVQFKGGLPGEAWNWNFSRFARPPGFPFCLVFKLPVIQPWIHQVSGGQCSHCQFIAVSVGAFVYVSTSNPAFSSFCPPAGSMSAVWLWSQATIYSVSTGFPPLST